MPAADRLLLLALETTCDETGAAVLEGPRPPATGVPTIRSNVVASQVDLHERFGGVVPEMAAREHVRQLLPVVDEALRRAEEEAQRADDASRRSAELEREVQRLRDELERLRR